MRKSANEADDSRQRALEMLDIARHEILRINNEREKLLDRLAKRSGKKK
jgi:hypothetical protein